MSNFIDRFEAQLVATAPRPMRAHERLRRWIAGHAVASIAIAATATVATAGAAVTTLRGTPSAPLENRLSSAGGGSLQSSGKYRIAMAPLPGVGEPGWCSTFIVVGNGNPGGGGGCTDAWGRNQHIIAGGFEGFGKVAMAHFIVDERVAGVRLRNGHVVLAAPDPRLPVGFRAVVVISGEPGTDRFDNRDLAKWKLLDNQGRVIGTGDEDERAEKTVGKVIRAAARREFGVVHGELPSTAPCQITRTDRRPWPLAIHESFGLRAAPQANADLTGRPFLACAQVQLGDPGHLLTAMRATLFVDARNPGSRPDPLPGLAGPDDGRIAEVPTGGLPFVGASLDAPTGTVQRRGNAWLQVDGGTPAQQRELIARLTTRVNLG